MDKRCQFLDSEGKRCYRSPCKTTIVFLDDEIHQYRGESITWIATDLCDLHRKRLAAYPGRLSEEEEKIQ